MATVAEIDALADQLRTLAASFGVTNLRHWDDNPGWLVVTPPKTPGQVDAFEQAAFDQLDIDFECLTDDTHEASVLRLGRGRPIGPPGKYSEEGLPLRPSHLRGSYAPESGGEDEMGLDA